MEEDESTASLERIVRDDPEELENRIEQVHRRLQAENPHERMDAGRAFRVAAEENPELVSPHLETMVCLLSDQNGSLQLSGAIGIAELARTAPETVVSVVPELLSLLEDTHAPAIQMAILRALTRIGERSPDAVADADVVVATLLQTATPPIRAAIVTVFASVVIENPSRFPETVRAMEDALDDTSQQVRRYTTTALALTATTDQSALSSVERVRDRVEEMEARVNTDPRRQYGENVKRAARTLRSLSEGDRT